MVFGSIFVILGFILFQVHFQFCYLLYVYDLHLHGEEFIRGLGDTPSVRNDISHKKNRIESFSQLLVISFTFVSTLLHLSQITALPLLVYFG